MTNAFLSDYQPTYFSYFIRKDLTLWLNLSFTKLRRLFYPCNNAYSKNNYRSNLGSSFITLSLLTSQIISSIVSIISQHIVCVNQNISIIKICNADYFFNLFLTLYLVYNIIISHQIFFFFFFIVFLLIHDIADLTL